MNPVLRSAPPALVILDHMLVRRFEIDDVIPETKHAPENGIIQESELSRPINVVNQLLGGDQEKVLLEKVRSSIPAALRQLPLADSTRSTCFSIAEAQVCRPSTAINFLSSLSYPLPPQNRHWFNGVRGLVVPGKPHNRSSRLATVTCQQHHSEKRFFCLWATGTAPLIGTFAIRH